jgi:hypothetical protein
VRVGKAMAKPSPDLYLAARGPPEPSLRRGFFDLEPLAAVAFEQRGKGEGGGDAVALCALLVLEDEPRLLIDRGALIYDFGTGTYHLESGDVICIRSRPNAPPYYHTAALINKEHRFASYALPPNMQLTLEDVLEKPWTATSRRWHRYVEKGDLFFADMLDTFHDAEELLRHWPTTYLKIYGGGGRTRYVFSSPGHPRLGQLVNTIGYSPDETFERTITDCRCLVFTVAYPEASAPKSTGSSVAEARRHLRWQRQRPGRKSQDGRGELGEGGGGECDGRIAAGREEDAEKAAGASKRA